MIVLNDEINNETNEGENVATSLQTMDISPTRSYSYQNWNKYETLNDPLENLAETKKASLSSIFDHNNQGSYNTYSYNVDHPENEMDSVVTQSEYKKVYPSDIKKLPLVLQHALISDNSIIHYHEHDHIHRHKKVPSSVQKQHGRVKHINNSGLLFDPEQNSEPTQSYYRQKDYPRTSTRSKQKHKNSNQVHDDFSYPNNRNKNKYGQKRYHKHRRGDYQFNKYRRYPKWKTGRH